MCLESNKCTKQSGDQATIGCFNCDVQGCGLVGNACCNYQPNGIKCFQMGNCVNNKCQ